MPDGLRSRCRYDRRHPQAKSGRQIFLEIIRWFLRSQDKKLTILRQEICIREGPSRMLALRKVVGRGLVRGRLDLVAGVSFALMRLRINLDDGEYGFELEGL